jgi:hypothetical protein
MTDNEANENRLLAKAVMRKLYEAGQREHLNILRMYAMRAIAAIDAKNAADSAFVFLDDMSRPYLVFKGWLHYWHGDKKWVTFRELNPGESETLELRKIPDDQAALYGFPDNLKPQKESQ